MNDFIYTIGGQVVGAVLLGGLVISIFWIFVSMYIETRYDRKKPQNTWVDCDSNDTHCLTCTKTPVR